MKALLGTLSMCVMLAGALPLEAAVLYATDDGESDSPIAGGPPIPADLWWGKSYDVLPGGNIITDLQVAFGSTNPVAGFDGFPVQIFLYDDSDNDGDPNTGLVRLQTVSTTTQFSNTDTFLNVSIPPTPVSGKFFVAALMSNTGYVPPNFAPAGEPAGYDQDTLTGTSWVADGSNGVIDPDNVTGTANLSGGIINIDGTNFPGPNVPFDNRAGDLMLRAIGVPEPAGVLLLAVGCGLLSLRRRQR